jgi:glycogen operon protein
MRDNILPGRSFPLGATVYPNGTNFCVFSNACEAMELLFFDDVDDKNPSRIIRLDPKINKTFYYWHIFVPRIGSGQLYGYRAYGPFLPEEGFRFDGKKVLLDPYAKAIAIGKNYSREAAVRAGDNCPYALKGVVVDLSRYDWEDDFAPRVLGERTVIYELHAGGFTKNPNSGIAEKKRGKYLGLIEKIPYLKSLGVTAVELMPVQQFDEQDAPRGLKNYWGYSPIGFFAPHSGYSVSKDPLGPVEEFRDMVKALHRAGIEVILDVVFNHTAEGDHNGPIFSFKGLENPAYYILDKDKSLYANYTGCGNTINANHSIVRRMIENCLCYWVMDMHVDGFRFDLASVMARGESGEPLSNPPILWAIESNPILSGTKIIAEAWDAAGLYQAGSFVGDRFAEWNGYFRDDVRRFVKSDSGTISTLAKRICGSPDIYAKHGRELYRSINFVTCHDGFTLNDLVSYNYKHNDANKEGNRDGTDRNFSWNCGEEGSVADPSIEKLRVRQIKNFLTILFVSQGTPMLLMGDEVMRTQAGNNNTYCQDNETSWFDWENTKKNAELLRFTQGLINFTKKHEIFSQECCWIKAGKKQNRQVVWHGINLRQPDWGHDSHSIAFTLKHKESGQKLYVILNSFWDALEFELPKLAQGECWHRIVDTCLESPEDFSEPESALEVFAERYKAEARSSVILMAVNKLR